MSAEGPQYPIHCLCEKLALIGADALIPQPVSDKHFEALQGMIKSDPEFDAAEAEDGQQRSLLKIAEGQGANSSLSQGIRRMVLFLELYKIDRKAPPAHKSKTCIVPLAEDYSDAGAILPEALKFMRNKNQFERELSVREGLDERFVIGVIRYYDSTIDPVFAAAIKSFHNGVYAEYPYCIVLPRANRGLHEVISHDHIAGVPERILDVKAIVSQIAEALHHFHKKGIIHAVSMVIVLQKSCLFINARSSSSSDPPFLPLSLSDVINNRT
jgi:hypothetical protein